MTLLRFAPSPNGYLHLGHAYSALLNEQVAHTLGGHFLLRIEDIDITRCTADYTSACLEDLAWLGLSWQEPVRIQSQHFPEYQNVITRLREQGLLYPCFCSRREINAASHTHDPEGAPLYPGTCRHISDGERARRIEEGHPHAWRLDMQKASGVLSGNESYIRFRLPDMKEERIAIEPQRWGDVILARKEIPTSYHISVVLDDALQNVTHIIRGQDLEAATDLHVLLMILLQLPVPLYHHHRLLVSGEGDKLAKSRKSESLRYMRARGLSAADIRQMLPL